MRECAYCRRREPRVVLLYSTGFELPLGLWFCEDAEECDRYIRRSNHGRHRHWEAAAIAWRTSASTRAAAAKPAKP